MPRQSPRLPNLRYERELRADGYPLIAGIDEAGRGPLAGPVSAAAVILPEKFRLPGLNDSKKLTASRRDEFFEALTTRDDILWSVVLVDAAEIDEINILRATHVAMARAFGGLPVEADAALIDGLPVKGFPVPQRALVKGDSLSLSIAAASILAKVTRDRLMIDFDREYPQYGFQSHKGYGTKQHLAALEEHGPCPIHRRSFRPITELADQFGRP